MTMVSPKSVGVGDSDATLSRRKSLRSHSSKRTVSEVTEVEEETKKKQKKMNKKKKKTKLSESLTTRIWNDEDVLSILKDAFETVMSQGLTDYQKKLELEKLRNIGADIRRELSDGWKELFVEERRLNMKKLRFSAKFAEALNDG